MKQFLFYSFLFIAACGNNNTATETQANNSTAEKKAEPSTSSAQDDEIVGEWEMVGFVMDTNDNLQIDEAERKNLKPASFKDYMKLNNDGTGVFTVAKMEGRYEATAKETGDKKFLTWYDKANGRIVSERSFPYQRMNCISKILGEMDYSFGKDPDVLHKYTHLPTKEQPKSSKICIQRFDFCRHIQPQESFKFEVCLSYCLKSI